MSTKAWHLLRPSPFVGWKSVRKETGVVSARSRGLSELEELQKEKEMGVETTTGPIRACWNDKRKTLSQSSGFSTAFESLELSRSTTEASKCQSSTPSRRH